MTCEPDCTCRGRGSSTDGVITPGHPDYDAAIARALDLAVSAPTQPDEREPR